AFRSFLKPSPRFAHSGEYPAIAASHPSPVAPFPPLLAADRRGGEAHAGEQLRDVRIPHAVRAPRPAAGIRRRRGLLVLVEPREIHAPLVAIPRRQRAPVWHREGLERTPRNTQLHGPAAVAVF